jgi:protein-S-isoprenylcysteine O-methyltransferase Ste14
METGAVAATSGSSPLVACGNFLFRYRNGVFPAVLLVLFAAFAPAYPGGSAWLDLWIDVLGFAVALAGQSLRVAVIGYAYIRRGGKHGRLYAARLVTEGFFRHSRNPLYLGNLLVLLGLFIIHGHPWVVVLGLAFFGFAYRAIVAAEEAYLGAKFPEYDDYCRRVRRWLPDFHGLRASLEGFEFDWKRVVVKEYGSAYAWTASVVFLLVYETLIHDHDRRGPGYLAVLAGVLAVLTLGWAAARYLKKGSILGDGAG